jgi:CRISPR-associated protein Cmr2
MNHFHFTLGPVQGFVAQARRTRDFWAGSFLLSYLTAHAMKATQEQSGTIVMPEVSGDMMLVRVRKGSGGGPTIGSVPNCFEAKVPDTFDGKAVAQAVQEEWERIAKGVWDHDKLEAAGANKALWDEQIKNFWEIAWVIAPESEPAALAMRKNWRNPYPPEQAGDKCTMMGEWQELSGFPAPNQAEQTKFWDKVRKAAGRISQLELREGERLCAIAYVKRRFVHAWKTLNPGWELPTGVPSTSYMAAVHWIEQVLQHADSGKIIAFQKAAKAIADYGEWSTSIHCIEKQVGDWGNGKLFASLDGRVFFRSALDNEQEFDAAKAQTTLAALNALADTEIKPGHKIGHPSPFYAILLMDGDNLGKTKAAMGGDATRLSAALGEFTGKVPGIVQDNNGFLVYAGGDDVLALLPLEDALDCALALRSSYMEVFKDKDVADGNYSISAAVIYAHMKLPLTLVFKDVHRLLDDVAKDSAQRDAIAVRVWKPGGAVLTWAMKWGEGVKGANVTALSELAAEFQQAEEGEPGHASKPLYRIRERLEMLEGGSRFTEDQIQKLLVAEYVTSGVLREEKRKREIAAKRITKLLPLCKRTKGDYGAEAAMLLRFLAQKGVER